MPFAEHRARLLSTLAESRLAGVFASGTEKVRNHDSTYRFRPESDFYYLTGFREPDSVLVLAPESDAPATLFLRERDRDQEIWNGRRLGVEAAPATLGVDRALAIEDLEQALPDLLADHEGVVYASGIDEARDRWMLEALRAARAKARGGRLAPAEWIHPERTLHEQRLIKSEAELERMRRGAAVTAEAHTTAMAEAAPGRSEAEIDARLEYLFRARGGTGAAYTNIVAGGPNACILHYIENDQPLRDGDLLLIDAGCEWDFYATDVTRTFPVSGTFTPEQRALYEVVLDAQVSAIGAATVGATFASVHGTALRRLVEGLVAHGLLEGSVDAAIEEERYREFYMHKTSHWLGLDVHDCGRTFLDGGSRVLEPGMVLTVEPGLYIAEDADVDPKWRGIGIRIEDDVLVAPDGPDVLTAATPKTVEEVEAACRGEVLAATR